MKITSSVVLHKPEVLCLHEIRYFYYYYYYYFVIIIIIITIIDTSEGNKRRIRNFGGET
jgi:hypothetical protein